MMIRITNCVVKDFNKLVGSQYSSHEHKHTFVAFACMDSGDIIHLEIKHSIEGQMKR